MNQAFDPPPLETALLGALRLALLVDAQGRFKYRFDANTGQELGGYNAVRHCGTMWAMMEVFHTGKADQKVFAACLRAAVYLQNEFIRFPRSLENACAVEGNATKLGGNALALLALLALNQTAKNDLLQAIAIRLGDFMLTMQKQDGDFIHKQYFDSGRASSMHSMYYTGEALLSLLKLYEASGEKRFLDAAIRCENILCPQDYGVKEHSHWMLYALEALFRHQREPRHYEHAQKIARHIIDHPDYRATLRSTPIACRSEGLLAFLRTSPPKKSGDDAKLRKLCRERIEEDLKLQMQFWRQDGSFIRGGKDKRHDEVRIDYIQHNISSFLYFSAL